MKWLKIGALVLLVLAAMRSGAWGLGWVLAKLVPEKKTVVVAAANTAGLAVFVLLLWWNLMPGEPVDWSAIVFGLVVFALCGVSDLFWTPWRAGRR